MLGSETSVIVLFIYLVVGTGMFAFLPPTKAFVLVYVIGILALPAELVGGYHTGAIYFTYNLVLDKITCCNLAALLGTCIFASGTLKNYRFSWLDVVYLLVPLGMFLTNVVNDLGSKAGSGSAVNEMTHYLPILFLSRLHLTRPADVYYLLRATLGGAVIYAGVSVVEWRFSPQLHSRLYGYFQHEFAQAVRSGHFRPFGMLAHALEFAFFMGSSAVAAIWLWSKKMFPPLWEQVPASGVVAIVLVGLLFTLTYSGFLTLAAGLLFFALMLYFPSRWLLVVIPIACMFWIVGRYTRVFEPQAILQMVADVDLQRADSLGYRFEAEDLNVGIGKANPVFGVGGYGRSFAVDAGGRLVRAVDSFWIIKLNVFGWWGLLTDLAVWSWAIFTTVWYWDRYPKDVRELATLISVLVGTNLIYFLANAGANWFLLMLNFGVVAMSLNLPKKAPLAAARRPGGFPVGYGTRRVGMVRG